MRLPNNSEREAIFGMTGSGKTVFGLYHLQMRNYDKMPWIIFDFKGDDTIARIPRIEEIDIKSNPPKRAGLYVVRPLPHEEAEVDEFLWKIWRNGKTGVYIDEGYSIRRFNEAFRAIMTQGRSKRVPVIFLSQRPSWISPFVMSECDYYVTFFMFNKPDVDRIKEFIPGVLTNTIPRFHSYMYDVKANEVLYLAPCPNENEILNRFDLKVAKRRYL